MEIFQFCIILLELFLYWKKRGGMYDKKSFGICSLPFVVPPQITHINEKETPDTIAKDYIKAVEERSNWRELGEFRLDQLFYEAASLRDLLSFTHEQNIFTCEISFYVYIIILRTIFISTVLQ